MEITDITTTNRIVAKNQYIQQPGDKMTQEMMPGGDIVTRVDTKYAKLLIVNT